MQTIMFPVILSLLVLLCCSGVANSQVTNSTEIPNDETSTESLKQALADLNNLTIYQQKMWKEQQLREDQMKSKTQQDVDREAERTRAMEKELRNLEEMKKKIARKIKAMSKPKLSNTNEQGDTSIRPKDCADIFLDGEDTSGIYRIWPTWDTVRKGYLVYCDMDNDGGGWTVIRKWGNSGFSNDFYNKTWQEYTTGFGDLLEDFWLGNELIHMLTNQAAYEVRFQIEWKNGSVSTTYRRFWTDDGSRKYTAHVEEMFKNSTAGDLFRVHNNAPFSTLDYNNKKDERKYNDYYYYNRYTPPEVCAFGWWFMSNCNISPYLDPRSNGSGQSDMKIRPVGFAQLSNSY